MKIKRSIIVAVLALGILTACTDKKKTDEQKSETTKVESKEETAKEEAVSEAEKRRLDSIRQVKEHGHAH